MKATVDAYTGRVTLYALEPDEPILAAWAGVFPALFEPLSRMDTELQRHLKYPASYLRVQADVLEEYHVDSPEVFYTGQDGWQVPQESTAQGGAGGYQPQYVLLRPPGSEQAEFLLTLPFIARERQNMTAILVVWNDPARYGDKVLLELPRDGQTLGPTQVRALIEQDATISQMLTFWRTAEREVDLGRIRVLPLDDAVLYVQPLFLSAVASSGSGGSIPQLQRVIVSDGSEVRMAETLRGALAALADEEAAPMVSPLLAPTGETSIDASGPTRALALFEEAQRRLRAGDFRGFADVWDELERLLRQLAEGRRQD